MSQERGLFGGVLPEVQAFVKPVLPGLFKPIRNSWPVLVPTLGVAPQRRVRTRQIMGNLAITGLQLALLLNRKNARREWKCVVR